MSDRSPLGSEPLVRPGDETDVVPALAEAPRRGRWLGRVVVGLLGVLVLSAGLAVAALAAVERSLPGLFSVADYRPKQATVVYGKDGQVVARFASERRTVVPFEKIPKVMVDAVVAAEDGEFFEHAGIDYVGIFRCMVLALTSGRLVCGGSTITQQTVKTFLLTPERNLVRKVKEFLLAKRMEEAFTKNEILYLYLNQIYFGHGAYGVEEAARVYFGKSVSDLGVEEAALLAGLPQSPTRLDPYKSPTRATQRRAYVLGQMAKLGKIDAETHKRALATPIAVDWRRAEQDLDNTNHYAAHVRALLEAQVGPERAVDGGLKVYAAIDPRMQRAAERELEAGLRQLDKRQGYRGPRAHLDADQVRALLARLEARRSTVAASRREDPSALVFDLARVSFPAKGAPLELPAIAEAARFRPLAVEERYVGVVTAIDGAAKRAIVSLGGAEVALPLRTGLAWARPYNLKQYTARPSTPEAVLKKGDVVEVAIESLGGGKTKEILGRLEQTPIAQAILVAIDPSTREVRALVGGLGSGAGTFNRATQAKRQAGSTYKPILYGAALETGTHSVVSRCLDAPHVVRDPWTGKSWKPQNYDGKFEGEITLRTALTKSKNLCSVWLIHQIGVDKVSDLGRRLGVASPMPRSDTLALGSGEVVPLEMVNAYASVAAEGRFAEPVFIEKIVDPEGALLFEAKREARQAVAAGVAYGMTSMMQSVVEDGTATPVKKLGRPVAGKTGTTNESRDAWFIGYTPDLVAGVWVGHDDNQPLGPSETGGRAAIPIWLGFMEEAMKDAPVRDFSPPPEVVFAYVDPKTGLLASPDDPGAAYEPFLPGTEPSEVKTEVKAPVNFGLDDYE